MKPQTYIRCLLGRYAPKLLARLLFYRTFKRFPNIDHPTDLNEHILYEIFHTDTSAWTRLGDKYAMRGYIEELGLGHMLPRLYGVWERAEDIDFDKIPRPFVLKLNNGSGGHFFIRENDNPDFEHIRRQLARRLHNKYGYLSAEPQYIGMPPRIIAEEMLDITKQDFESKTLIDYKFICINGKPELLTLSYDRLPIPGYKYFRDVKMPDWEDRMDLWAPNPFNIPGDGRAVAPACLDELNRVAALLSKDFPQIRVDFYVVDGKPYIGELTFTNYAYQDRTLTQDALRWLGSKIIEKQ